MAGTGAGGVVTGLVGQWVYSSFQRWRVKKAIEMHYPELAPQSRWTLVRKVLDITYLLTGAKKVKGHSHFRTLFKTGFWGSGIGGQRSAG